MRKKKRQLIYFATPYTCQGRKSLTVRERIEGERFRVVTEVSILLFKRGLVFYSPITQSHTQKQIAIGMGLTLGGDFSFWSKFDLAILSFCTDLYVLKVSGWDTSEGVLGEMAEARRLRLPISFVLYDEEKQTIRIQKEK
jgi:hypothetical protein